MKKLTDFIIDKRYYVIALFIILTIVCGVLSQKVKINYDIAKYLPGDSETRIGMDIMEDEFETTTSTLNIMFNDLNEEQKQEVFEELKVIDNVKEVDYDESEKYNIDNHTLYTLTVDGEADSENAKNVYNTITTKYEEYKFETSGDVSEYNKPVLHTWIIVLAVGCALVILIIMCESYTEPFLFLIAILMAVVINKGTNIMFSSVSNITNSICAILQMALSMDYSIMLMNRYTQEKKNEKDNVKAMKEALYHAFGSISSSSVTTIVGLLALVFMSFTIGKDLGFVLAKGVLFSLLTIFCVLPGLILMCDKLITKTKKKVPVFKLDALGKASYKLRFVAVPVFIIAFVGSYILQGNLLVEYTGSENDEVGNVFGETNQMAIIYKSSDEAKIAELLPMLESEVKNTQVLAYSNTINQNLKYNELTAKFDDLGQDVSIEDYLLKVLYYNYYNRSESNKMSFNDFVSFIRNEVYNNDDMSDILDDETKSNVERLANFASSEEINKQRSIEEIANILEINKEDVEDIMVFYNSKNNDVKLSLKEFIKFMNQDVLTSKYAESVPEEAKESLKQLEEYADEDTINKNMTSVQMAELFGMDKSTMEALYTYYISQNDVEVKLSLADFADFVLNDVANNELYSSSITKETLSSLQLLKTFSNTAIINTQMTPAQISSLLGIDENIAKSVLILKYGANETEKTQSLSEFIVNVVNLKNNTNYLDGIDISSLEKLYTFAKNENGVNTIPMNKVKLSYIFDNVSQGLVDTVYTALGLPDAYEMTPQTFVSTVLQNMSSYLSKEQVTSLSMLKTVIDDSVSQNKVEYKASELATMLGIENKQMYQIYALIDLVSGNTASWTVSPYEFASLILANVSNKTVSENLNQETLAQVKLLYGIMNSSLNNETYTYSEIAGFIGVDESMCKDVYALYKQTNSAIKLTPYEFVNFVLEHKNDERLASSMTDETVSSLNLVNKIMTSTLNKVEYSSLELADFLGMEKDSIDLLYGLYNYKNVMPDQTISLNNIVSFILNDVVTNEEYSDKVDSDSKAKLDVIYDIMNNIDKEYNKTELYKKLSSLADNLDKNTIDLLYVYYGSQNEYDENWTMTIENFVKFINEDILTDFRFDDFIDDEMKEKIVDAKTTISDAKDMLVGKEHSRIVLNTSFELETEDTHEFIQKVKDWFADNGVEAYIIGDSPMAYEMSKSFGDELNFITILTMVAIFVVVALTFKSILIPLILVLTIQCAVYMTMGFLSFSGDPVYFIALLIVQSILMGATIDYAIVYTSYYIEHRKEMSIKEAIINSYNKSIHTIITSASILILVTLIVGNFASAIAAMICRTISVGTLCSAILILILLPAVIAACDKFIIKNKK